VLQTPGITFDDQNLCLGGNTEDKLRSTIELIEHTDTVLSVHILNKDLPALVRQFEAFYQPIEAAGGVVVNAKRELLTIFRRGKWDLPKGKVDKGERITAAAVREVREETNVSVRDPETLLLCTRHTYPLNGQRILKTTWWFLMDLYSDKAMAPERSEDIEKVEWAGPEKVEHWLLNTYGSIKDVIHRAQEYLPQPA